jgi:hypothetical protein
LLPQIFRAGDWFLRSGIQTPEGGVCRYYRADSERNEPVSTEITGYAISTLVYLHSLTRDSRHLDAAGAAARFLARTAWDRQGRAMPFELGGPTYFFDCGIIVRGLLSAWRATGEEEYRGVATAVGRAMSADFASDTGDYHPVLSLPEKRPLSRDGMRWSHSAGCYQLKAAMAWCDLAEATGDSAFRATYDRVLAYSLRTSPGFLPGHPDPHKVMDRLHAFAYFLEGLLPAVADPHCAAALCGGIRSLGEHLRRIAPEFERSDVYAQLLRIRLYADWAGVAPLDVEAAEREAERLAAFQLADSDVRVNGGFSFGVKHGSLLPYVNPVSTAFALQALALWDGARKGAAQAHRHLLI